jgi:cytochrome oxidase Cu insertion factor (SCO1/SenC/PrrC family)
MSCNALFKAWHLPFGGGVIAVCLFLFGLSSQAQAASGTLKPIESMNIAEINFDPPAVGTYELQYIMRAADGAVLDIEGATQRLDRYTGGKVTLLSFIYSSCADPDGCPYAYTVFHNLKNRLERDPRLHNQVRLVSLSFDPKRDTPQMLKLYAGDHALPDQPVTWDFLTTDSLATLLPLLNDFGQDVFIDLDRETQQPVGTYSHVLKIFLIDRDHTVREIYTTAYLHPDMVYNDIITLLQEQGIKLP